MDLRFLLLLVCFFVSGFAALLYQTAWTREFAFLFGTSELAVVAVLAAYMGGLALGAAVASRIVGRLTRPVLAYGLLELGIAVGALCVPVLIRAVQALYIALAGGLDAPPEAMALTTAIFHLFGSFVVLVPCTALMGATLPLLARYAVSEDAQVGPRIGVLYAINTFGAIAGTLVAAFYFLPAFGLRYTVYIGIFGNAIVFVAAAALARGIAGMPAEDTTPEARAKTTRSWAAARPPSPPCSRASCSVSPWAAPSRRASPRPERRPRGASHSRSSAQECSPIWPSAPPIDSPTLPTPSVQVRRARQPARPPRASSCCP